MPITCLEFATAASKLETLDLEWKWIDSKNSNLPISLVSFFVVSLHLLKSIYRSLSLAPKVPALNLIPPLISTSTRAKAI